EGESESLLAGKNFGIVTNIVTGPDGNLYVTSLSNGAVYMISNKNLKQTPSSPLKVAMGGNEQNDALSGKRPGAGSNQDQGDGSPGRRGSSGLELLGATTLKDLAVGAVGAGTNNSGLILSNGLIPAVRTTTATGPARLDTAPLDAFFAQAGKAGR